MFFELRLYHSRPGQRARWVEYMEEVIIPFQISKGMVVVGSFVCQEDEDMYVWIRRFDSEAHREQLYQAVYQSERWQQEISPRVEELLDRQSIQVIRLEPTSRSVIR
jgi:hypothetical protein